MLRIALSGLAYLIAAIQIEETVLINVKRLLFNIQRNYYTFAIPFPGEMSEWSKEHAWKVCIPLKGIEGSNPSLSANNPVKNN